MILEIRRYTLHPGQREAGMLVFGPLRDLDDPEKVHWMRAFQSLEHRDAIKQAFYDGPVWAQDVEPLVMPLIAHYEASVVETTQGFEGFNETASL